MKEKIVSFEKTADNIAGKQFIKKNFSNYKDFSMQDTESRKVRFVVSSYDVKKLDEFVSKFMKVLKEQKNISRITNVVMLPIKCKRFTLIRAPFKDSKSKDHFEIRIFSRLFDVEGDIMIFFLNKIKIPNEIELKVKNLK